jgi:hypothetical protein
MWFCRPYSLDMGHVHLGKLPVSRAWNAVVRLLTNHADVETIAAAAQNASDKAFAHMTDDPGFGDAVSLLSQLAVAARKDDPAGHLAVNGLIIPANPSVLDVGMAIGNALELKARERRNLSDLAILTNGAMVSSVTQHLKNVLGELISPTGAEIHTALHNLGRETQFGKLARTFFFNLAKDCQRHFLSKELGAQIGENRAFSTTAQVSQFEAALDQHAYEASEIVERFSSKWFSKNHHEGEGDISTKKSSGFGWRALGKIREEMTVRAASHAH